MAPLFEWVHACSLQVCRRLSELVMMFKTLNDAIRNCSACCMAASFNLPAANDSAHKWSLMHYDHHSVCSYLKVLSQYVEWSLQVESGWAESASWVWSCLVERSLKESVTGRMSQLLLSVSRDSWQVSRSVTLRISQPVTVTNPLPSHPTSTFCVWNKTWHIWISESNKTTPYIFCIRVSVSL